MEVGIPSEAEAFRSVHPEEFAKRFIDVGVRPDGRRHGARRPCSVIVGTLGKADGSAMVKAGSTTVSCGVKLQVGTPSADTPKMGLIDVNVHLPPSCSPRFGPGKPPEEALSLGQFLQRIIVDAGVLPLESLCIEEGKAAWAVSADVVCVSYDGNVTDAALLALMAALRDVRVPKPTVADDGVVSIDPRACSRLTVRRMCASLTCCVVSGALVADPTAFEEDVAQTTVTVVRGEGGVTCGVRKYGGLPLRLELVHRAAIACDEVLQSHVRKVQQLASTQ